VKSHYDFAVGPGVISPGVNLKKNHYLARNGHDPTQSIVHTSYLTRWVTLWNGLNAFPGYVQIHTCQSGRFSSCVKLQNQLQLLNFSYPPMLHTSLHNVRVHYLHVGLYTRKVPYAHSA
jgi:hypothetical protein